MLGETWVTKESGVLILKSMIESHKPVLQTVSEKQHSAYKLLPGSQPKRSSFQKKALPLTLIFIAFGLAPIKIKDGRIQYSVYRIIYGMTLIVASGITILSVMGDSEETTLYLFMSNVFDHLPSTCCLISMLWLSFNRKRLIIALDKAFQILVYIEPVNITKQLKQELIAILVTFLVPLAGMTYECILDGYEVLDLLYQCLSIHLLMTLSLLEVQFVLGISIFTNILSSVRKAVSSLSSNGYQKLKVTSDDIDEIFGIHENIMELTEDMVYLYGFVLGSLFLMAFLYCTIFAYYITVEPNFVSYPYFTSWTAFLLIPPWLILTATSNFTSEMERTCQQVYKAYRNVPIKEIQEKLHNFLIYLLHRKVDFSICGLVPLNCTILLSMAGSITIYMVIIIQFESSKN